MPVVYLNALPVVQNRCLQVDIDGFFAGQDVIGQF